MGTIFGGLCVKRQMENFILESISGEQVFCNNESTASEQVISIQELKLEEIYFRYQVRRNGIREIAETEDAPQEKICMEYSLDGIHYQLGLVLTAKEGRWVGVKNGVFIDAKDGPADGYAQIEYVHYHK